MLLDLICLFFGLVVVKGSPIEDLSLHCLLSKDGANITLPSNPKQNGQAACAKLASTYPGNTFLPNTANYTLESSAGIWSATCILTPVCAFTPQTPQELAEGLAIIRKECSPFSVRSGGHMPVPGAQSTNTGVMIGMTHFNTNSLINGTEVAQIGTGQRWADVYEWISPYGLAVAGGRYGEVGVGGLLLGGGINNFGNSHGWSVSNIVGYQVVLADSSIVEVSATAHSDLFWALKGGGNNFAIVTRFDMKTIPITAAFTGITAWAGDVFPQYIKAIADFITPGGGIDDPLTQINPTVSITPPNGTLQALNIPFIAGNTKNPASLENFTAITPNIFNDLGPRANWASGAEELVAFNILHERELFWSLGLKAEPEIVQLAYETVLFSARDQLANVAGSDVSVAYQPISKAWLQRAKDAGGDAIDLDPADGSFVSMQSLDLHQKLVWTLQLTLTGTLVAYHWENESDDAQMIAWGESVVANLTQKAKAAGLYYPFIYMNDAAQGERPFLLYGKGKSLPRLKAIQQKYDPQGLLRNLEASGFKLDA